MKGLSGRKPKSVQQPGHFFREQPGQAPNCSRWRHSRTEVRLYLARDDKPLAGHMPWDPPKADLNQRASRLLWSAAVAECLLPLQNVPLDNQTVWWMPFPANIWVPSDACRAPMSEGSRRQPREAVLSFLPSPCHRCPPRLHHGLKASQPTRHCPPLPLMLPGDLSTPRSMHRNLCSQ